MDEHYEENPMNNYQMLDSFYWKYLTPKTNKKLIKSLGRDISLTTIYNWCKSRGIKPATLDEQTIYLGYDFELNKEENFLFLSKITINPFDISKLDEMTDELSQKPVLIDLLLTNISDDIQ